MPDLENNTYGEHRIEQTAQVYLEHDGLRWTVAASTVDGHELDGGRAATCAWDHTADKNADIECEALRERADETPLPTAAELIPLIAEHLSVEELLTASVALHREGASRG